MMWSFKLLSLQILIITLAIHQSQQATQPSQSALIQQTPPVICTEHAATSFASTPYSIQNYAGDATVSILTNEPIALRSINLAGLNAVLAAESNVTLGVRILHTPKLDESVRDLLLLEVQYLQQCTASPIAILVIYEMWPIVAEIADDIEYDIWRLPPAWRLLFPKVAHLLYELPWNAGQHDEKRLIDVQAADLLVEEEFLGAARSEHLCLDTMLGGGGTVDAYGMQIALGRAIWYAQNGAPNVAKVDDEIGTTVSTTSAEDQERTTSSSTLFAVPLVAEDYAFIANLTAGSYVVRELDSNGRVTVILTITAILNQLTKLLHQSLQDCNATASGIITNTDEGSNSTDIVVHSDPFAIDHLLSCRHPEHWNLNAISTLSAHHLYAELQSITLNIDPTIVLSRKLPPHHQQQAGHQMLMMRHIATVDLLTNVTTFYNYSDQPTASQSNNDENNATKLGHQFACPNASRSGDTTNINIYNIYNDPEYSNEPYWRIRSDIWVAIGLTLAVLGVLISFAIFVFILVRLYMEDVLEGNPVGTIALLIALIVLFVSFIPFSLEYTSDRHLIDSAGEDENESTPTVLCAVRMLFIMLGYCFPFALLLCRTIMLASIGGEGGFLSHVNGYVQSVICAFSVLVQIGMSVQLVVVLLVGYSDGTTTMSCSEFYEGAWFWVLLGYDGLLLAMIVVLAPFCVRSQRNYKEGTLILIGSILCVAVWATWIPLATALGREWREAAIPLGMQATGWAILGAILVPRSFLIVRGIARADMAQALPSLASLAFAHNSQCMSEQSIYECVNPAMRQQTTSHMNNNNNMNSGGTIGGGGGSGVSGIHRQIRRPVDHIIAAVDDDDDYGAYDYTAERCHSPSEIPTLPLRGASRKARNLMVEYATSQQSTLPASPNKATRF